MHFNISTYPSGGSFRWTQLVELGRRGGGETSCKLTRSQRHCDSHFLRIRFGETWLRPCLQHVYTCMGVRKTPPLS